MTTPMSKAEKRALPEITIDGVEFQLWSDGDLGVDLRPHSDDGWVGHYFSRSDAQKLRDWLIEALS